jgi:hypothetical protein
MLDRDSTVADSVRTDDGCIPRSCTKDQMASKMPKAAQWMRATATYVSTHFRGDTLPLGVVLVPPKAP